MIVGSGLLASAMDDRPGVIFYAAGVSNALCVEPSEFARDKARLESTLARPGRLVYFSTTSEADSAYVRHKRDMERLIRQRGDFLICRCPNIAGKTPNPHTILNFLYARISRSEGFDCWALARRNIIDILDVREVVKWLLKNAHDEIVNVAAPFDYAILDIVAAFVELLGKRAYPRMIEKGDAPGIDTSRIADAPVDFSGDYLGSVLRKYYA